MPTIATRDLRKDDVPVGDVDWANFSVWALTFDPVSEAVDEVDQVPASAIPADAWNAVALRYFLYCQQRIGNNQGGLQPEASDRVQAALRILRSKL